MSPKRTLTFLVAACFLSRAASAAYEPVDLPIPCNAGNNGEEYTLTKVVGVERVGDEREVVVHTTGQCQFTRLEASGDGLAILQTTPATLPAASVTYRVRITAGNRQGTLTVSGDLGPIGRSSGGGQGSAAPRKFQVTVTVKWVRVTFTTPEFGVLSLVSGESSPLSAKVELGNGETANNGTLGWNTSPADLGTFTVNSGPLAAGVGITTFTLTNSSPAITDGKIVASASDVTDYYQNNLGSGTGNLPLNCVRIALVPDYNRDRKIDDGDKAWAQSGQVFRWWINDDQDAAAGPADDSPASATPNANDNEVNGVADVVDFFPVWLDIRQVALLCAADHDYSVWLRHTNAAVNVVFTDLKRNQAGRFLTTDLEIPVFNNPPDAFQFPSPLAWAAVHPVPAAGLQLPAGFLSAVVNDAAAGVILVEGRAATTEPLILELRKNQTVVSEARLPLQLGCVTNMYRWINLRHVVNAEETRPTNVNPPTLLPDNATNGKHLVLVHGYNVPEADAWAFGAEKFKQFYQSGCNAMVTTVTWRGDAWNVAGLDLAKLAEEVFGKAVSLDYYKNVMNAFDSASAFKAQVSNLPGQRKCILAHSLGNMLVSSAIRDHGLSVQQFFMVNAAVAREAYDSSIHDDQMIPEEWRIFNAQYFSANWHQLFPVGDGRRNLAWRNRFGDIPNAHNYFAVGDEVLNNWADGSLPPLQQFRDYAWIKQERLKGNAVFQALPLATTRGGGWNINPIYMVGIPPTPIPPQDTNALKTTPFFYPFSKPKLFTNEGDAEARKPEVRALLLGGEIPALSFATGRNQIPNWQLVFRNTEMKSIVEAAQSGWPSDLPWRHCDINDIPYRFTFPVIDHMVKKGGLQ